MSEIGSIRTIDGTFCYSLYVKTIENLLQGICFTHVEKNLPTSESAPQKIQYKDVCRRTIEFLQRARICNGNCCFKVQFQDKSFNF